MDTNFDNAMNCVIDNIEDMVKDYDNNRKTKLLISVIIGISSLFLIYKLLKG